MYKQIIVFFLISLFSLNVYSSPEADVKDAVYFVEQTNLGKNLYSISYRHASRTQTYQMILLEFGKRKASRVLNTELTASIKKYQQQWNKNLALSYLEYFTPIELNSILKKKGKSPYIHKMKDKQKEIGISMQKRSKQIIIDVGSEALEKAFSQTVSK
jgi:hypothetical protein